MQKKLTITIDEEVYTGLHKVIGPGKISRFVEDLVRPHVVKRELEAAYEEMSKDKSRCVSGTMSQIRDSLHYM